MVSVIELTSQPDQDVIQKPAQRVFQGKSLTGRTAKGSPNPNPRIYTIA